MCCFPSSPLSSTCSSSDPNFHFHQLIPVAFVVVHVLYECIIMGTVYVVGEVKMTEIFFVYPQASGFASRSSENAFECCRMVSPCHTPFLILILLLSLCRWTVNKLLV